MSYLKLRDGARLFYKDWGAGQPVVFSHGWPLCADAWDNQMMFLARRGYRVIAHDRRGHGRSQQTWRGHDMDTYADDLAELFDQLDLQDAVLVGHSTGGGEVTRYIGRRGTRRVSRVVLLSAVPPLMLKTDENPGGLPLSLFDELRASVLRNRSQFLREFAVPFFGFNRPGAQVSQALIDAFWFLGMMAGVNAVHDCIRAFSETDFHEDLKKIDVPTLIAHGDDDQIVPIAASAELSAKIIPGAVLKVYPGAPHGLAQTMPDTFNQDLLQFIEAGQVAPTAEAPATVQ
ncbi:MAG: alpha/beta hydrolase [Myxococcaceae bacterium]|nr:alpha/beta hydrolase [Myxococcaceae bacterium]